jgi:hypothetical protein
LYSINRKAARMTSPEAIKPYNRPRLMPLASSSPFTSVALVVWAVTGVVGRTACVVETVIVVSL